MKLSDASEHDVVRNTSNGSYYRYSRPEKSRARIRPLELFPNGRLIPKPTDTLVDADLEVQLVGPWHVDMVVEGAPTHSRKHYEAELVDCTEYLAFLEVEYEKLPNGGVGTLSRGSWANKLKNCRARIEALQAGLASPDGTVRIERPLTEQPLPDLTVRDVVQMPSGQPGLIVDFMQVGASQYAKVRMRTAKTLVEAPLPCEILRPWASARQCTL
jgi:hypothetical protein